MRNWHCTCGIRLFIMAENGQRKEKAMILFIGLSGLFMIPLGIYLYVLLRRVLSVIFRENRLRLQKILSAVLAAVSAALSVNLFGLWALVVLHIAAISLIIDIIRLIMKKAGCRFSSGWDTVYRSGMLAVALTAAVMGYAYVNMHQVRTVSYTVHTKKAVREEGYRIVFLSDLHFGTTMGQEQLKAYCMRMEEENPDLVVLGGDIVDEAAALEEVQQAFQTLGTIRSTFGAYYVYGNHDKGKYSQNCDFTQEQLEQAVREAGIQILADDTILLNGELSISGRRDRSDAALEQISRESAQNLLKDVPSGVFHILADHQPRDMEENASAGYDLMLSGHTHAGQMWPVGLITTLFDKGTVNYGQKSFGDMELIVSSGIGGWGYPLRTGKHSEYVVIQIIHE